jgi:hypothetical protein
MEKIGKPAGFGRFSDGNILILQQIDSVFKA